MVFYTCISLTTSTNKESRVYIIVGTTTWTFLFNPVCYFSIPNEKWFMTFGDSTVGMTVP